MASIGRHSQVQQIQRITPSEENQRTTEKSDMGFCRLAPGNRDSDRAILSRHLGRCARSTGLRRPIRRFSMSDAQLESLLNDADAGDAAARAQLFAILYKDLRRMARRALDRDGAHLMISPTTILHETYLDISKRSSLVFPDRAHFMAYAARAMRGLILNYASSRRALKRGGGFHITRLPTEGVGL